MYRLNHLDGACPSFPRTVSRSGKRRYSNTYSTFINRLYTFLVDNIFFGLGDASSLGFLDHGTFELRHATQQKERQFLYGIGFAYEVKLFLADPYSHALGYESFD